MKDFTYLNRIEAYLDGHLSSEEQATFEQELKQNDLLKKEYEACLASELALDVLAFKGMMSRITQKESTRKEASKPALFFWTSQRRWTIAASFTMLMILTGLIYSYLNFSDTSIIVSNYEISKPIYSDFKGDLEGSSIKRIKSAFQNKQYELVQNNLLSIESTHPDYGEYQLILGCTALQQGETQPAITIFNDLKNSNNIRRQRAQFLLILAYLQVHNELDAKSEMNRILQNPKHDFFKETQTLADDLNSFWRKWVFF